MGLEELSPNHYVSGYQHWDLVIATGMQYLEGNATKYISRWRKKGRAADLGKALHYTNKLLEALPIVISRRGERLVGWEHARDEAIRFCKVNKLSSLESMIVISLATWRSETDVLEVRDDILRLMDEADEAPDPIVLATDSNKHAFQREGL